MKIDIKQMRLDCIQFDNSVLLYFGEHRDHSIRIENKFTVRANNESVEVSFEAASGGGHSEPRGTDALVDLTNEKVTDATADNDGTLRIDFTNEKALIVPPDKDYESWHYTSPRGVMVSLPGGGLG